MPRKNRTKQEILDALTEATAEADFEKVTVGEICSRASVSRQTFYQHFRDKFEVTTWLIDQLLQDSFQKLGTSMTWREAYLSEFRAIEEHVHAFPNVLARFTQSQDYNAIVKSTTRQSMKDFEDCYRRATNEEPIGLIAYQIERFALTASLATTDWIRSGCSISAEIFVDYFLTLIPRELFDALNAPFAKDVPVDLSENRPFS